MTKPLTLHEYAPSGNCYKIRLTAALLGVPIERRHYDIARGETRTPDFLAHVNVNGRIPVLQVGDRLLPESNAACLWLAHGSPLIPTDRFDQADMMRWLFWEQYNHEPNIATVRYWRTVVSEEALDDLQKALLPGKIAAGKAALTLMDHHLRGRRWLVGEGPTVADICLYAYTHVAGEGGFSLADYPSVGSWLGRVARLPGHIEITD